MLDRRRRGQPDPLLDWKLRIFFAGGALLAASMLLRRDLLALLAILVLASGMVLMVIGAARTRRLEEAARAEAEAWDEDEAEPEAR